ncbi:hypothetical protein IWW37_006105 [Coemansia sp. RSA 2050]|nr:hypothetical protein IWW37_006105 [Coemansia sp. RSA 2050]
MSTAQKLCLDNIHPLYTKGTVYNTYASKAKTRVEMRMIGASALIRLIPTWSEHLYNKERRKEWAALVKESLKLTDKEVEYVFAELEYYVQLEASGYSGEKLGGVDKVWINDTAGDCELVNGFKENAAKLADNHATAYLSGKANKSSDIVQILVDPFTYPFSSLASRFLDRPITTPEAALDFVDSADETHTLNPSLQRVEASAVNRSGNTKLVYSASFSDPATTLRFQSQEELLSWLPTDFNVNNDGSVQILSYINNLHPTRYAGLYGSISKVFAKMVPLLEQVATDTLHPRDKRAFFDCQKTEAYAEPEPLPFNPGNRPIAPYSMRGLNLQASVEMTNINLTPENPTLAEGRWQAIGRKDERVFAVGLYFYEMENIASAKLKMRDPIKNHLFRSQKEKDNFCKAHNVIEDSEGDCKLVQEFEGIDIRDGRYICYPNLYQVKMPAFTLADPTKAGCVKCIAFYIVDPATKVKSTGIIPPRDPSWDKASHPTSSALADTVTLNLSEQECIRRDFLRRKHAKENECSQYQFEASIEVDIYIYG